MPMLNRFRAMNVGPESFAPGLTHHVFLIAIGGEPETPILHRGNPLHPMQVMLTRPGHAPPFAEPDSAIGPLPALPAPRRLVRTFNQPAARIPREITGEILRDGNGKLYEKVGDSVRPINQLFTGLRGEMIDLAPVVTSEAPANDHSRLRQRQAATVSREPPAAAVSGDDSVFVEDGAEQATTQEAKPFRELVRRLVPEPGLWRLVRYADFIDVITPQLADPRRLQLGHQLACYLQVHEVTVTQAVTALEESAARELGNAGKLLPLSYDLCRRFALSLPRPSLALTASRQMYSPGIVPAGARFITLRVALDPTVDAVRPAMPQANNPVPAMATPVAQATSVRAPAVTVTPVLKGAIPENFMKAWDLKLSRDEAIYDMTLEASRSGLRRLLARIKNRISSREMHKWHALLHGKTPDEQLWDIRPPHGAIANPQIRRWAEQTLQLGGYDVARMLVEWEIHWRCKGL